MAHHSAQLEQNKSAANVSAPARSWEFTWCNNKGNVLGRRKEDEKNKTMLSFLKRSALRMLLLESRACKRSGRAIFHRLLWLQGLEAKWDVKPVIFISTKGGDA